MIAIYFYIILELSPLGGIYEHEHIFITPQGCMNKVLEFRKKGIKSYCILKDTNDFQDLEKKDLRIANVK